MSMPSGSGTPTSEGSTTCSRWLPPASRPALSRAHGVTPERVEAEIVRLSGADLFGDLDRDALTTVGIDADAVRAATEASFSRATFSHELPATFTGGRADSARAGGPERRGTGSSCRTVPASTRPSWVPAARHIRAGTEHRDPGPLPARELTCPQADLPGLTGIGSFQMSGS
jgi:hypothetical protein